MLTFPVGLAAHRILDKARSGRLTVRLGGRQRSAPGRGKQGSRCYNHDPEGLCPGEVMFG